MHEQLNRIEFKLDQILAHLLKGVAGDSGTHALGASRERPHNSDEYLPTMTTKQHAVLQMLLGGKSNQDIADRFGVTDNTAKVYVRSIAKKLGVNTRAQIVARTLTAYNSIDESSYRMVAGGLPKDWDENFVVPDPFAQLYVRKDDGTQSEIEE
jgi:DNA-binding CsgD family transcriptional regulator